MASSININQNNNDITLQDNNRSISITDNNAGTTVNVTQPVTSVVTVATPGPQGPVGPIPTSGSFTGSFSGSFIGNLTGTASYALTASYLEGYISPFPYSGSAVITGSLTVSGSSTFTNIGPAIFSGSVNGNSGFTGSFTGSFAGNGSGLTNIPASGITGLNLSQIATGSISASVSPGTASFQITSGSSTFMFVSSSGNVGIGTITPITTLSVTGTETSGRTIQIRSSAGKPFVEFFTSVSIGVIGSAVAVTGGSANDYGLGTNGNSTANIVFGTGAGYSERMRIFGSTGNIGVNTTTDAGYKLDVNGTARLQGNLTMKSNTMNWGTDFTNNSIVIYDGGTATNRIGYGVSGTSGGGVLFSRGSGLWMGMVQDANTMTAGNAYIAFDTTKINVNKEIVTTYLGNVLTLGTSTTTRNGIGITAGVGTQIFAGTGNNIVFGIANDASNLTLSNSALNIFSATKNIGINTGVDIASSLVTMESTTKGFLPPRTNLTSNISTPAQGLMTYVTASVTEGLYYYSSGSIKSWTRVLNDTGSQAIYGSLGINRLATASLDVAGTTRISGSFNTAISGSILTVIGSGSAQPIFTVQGSQGELFSITDSLSGSLFSVNDISGLPILEVFSDNTTLIGNYQSPSLNTTAKVVQTNSGSFTLYRLPTASYDTAFFEYSVKSGSNARAGTIMAIQLGSAVNFTETTTTSFGDTTAVSFTVIVSGSNMALTGSSTTGSWIIKTIVRGI